MGEGRSKLTRRLDLKVASSAGSYPQWRPGHPNTGLLKSPAAKQLAVSHEAPLWVVGFLWGKERGQTSPLPRETLMVASLPLNAVVAFWLLLHPRWPSNSGLAACGCVKHVLRTIDSLLRGLIAMKDCASFKMLLILWFFTVVAIINTGFPTQKDWKYL